MAMTAPSGGYQPRDYRRIVQPDGLVRFGVVLAESDLAVWATRDLRAEAAAALQKVRAELEAYIGRHPQFLTTRQPLDLLDGAPQVAKRMVKAARAAGVGPMAAVAGAVAQAVAEAIAPLSQEVIVENGGDVYMITRRLRLVTIVAPGSALTGRLALKVPAGRSLAVCTSSGTHGHSFSLGRADAAVIAAADGALADAVATATGNRVRTAHDIAPAIQWATSIDGVVHAVVLFGERFGTAGSLEVQPVHPHAT